MSQACVRAIDGRGRFESVHVEAPEVKLSERLQPTQSHVRLSGSEDFGVQKEVHLLLERHPLYAMDLRCAARCHTTGRRYGHCVLH